LLGKTQSMANDAPAEKTVLQKPIQARLKTSIDDIGLFTVEASLPTTMYIKVGSLEAFPMIGLVSLNVEENYRNQGIGTSILKKYITMLQKHNYARCVFTTHENNASMRKICAKLGFQEEKAKEEDDLEKGVMICTLALATTSEKKRENSSVINIHDPKAVETAITQLRSKKRKHIFHILCNEIEETE